MKTASPLRLLVKSYANGLLDRNQYLDIRKKLLRKLSDEGKVTHEDLQYLLHKYQDGEKLSVWNSYSLSDWIIIVLGFLAAIALAIILYN